MRRKVLLGIVIFLVFVAYVMFVASVIKKTSINQTPDINIGGMADSRSLLFKDNIDVRYDKFINIIKEAEKENHPDLLGVDVKLSIGKYFFVFGSVAGLYWVNDYRYFIFIDEDFHKLITPEEVNAIIGHEMGHLFNKNIMFYRNNILTATLIEIQADTFALKYVNAEVILSLLHKAFEYNPAHKLRIDNLNRSVKKP